MATELLHKVSPILVTLRGTDRRGANAALTEATATGLKVIGHFGDQADFTVPVIHKRDDIYGYMGPAGIGATRFLPDGNLAGMVLDVDVAISGAFSPLSVKFDSIGAAAISYTTEGGVSGSLPLSQFVTGSTGGAVASLTITIGGTIATNDLFYIVYLGNNQTIYQAPPGATPTSVASGLTFSMNTGAAPGLSIQPFAVWDGATGLTVYAGRSAAPAQYVLSGTSLTITAAARALGVGFWGLQAGDVVMFANGGTMEKHLVASVTSPWAIVLDSSVVITPTVAMWPLYHDDGNSVQLWAATNSSAGTMTNTGFPKLTGGATESAFHLSIDFTAAAIDDLFEAWFTNGPHPTYDSGATNPALVAFAPTDFSVVFTNWTVSDPGAIRSLKVAGFGTVTVGSLAGVSVSDQNVQFGGPGWVLKDASDGFYLDGFAKVSATTGDTVTVTYSCQATHDLYLGTVLRSNGGTFTVKLDGVSKPDQNTQFGGSGFTPLPARRLLAAGVSAGTHTVTLQVKAGGGNCYFDFIQAAVKHDIEDPAITYANFSAAADGDTGQTASVPPARAIDIMQRAGFQGDLDFFAGSIFPYRNVRYGGNFHQAVVSITGSVTNGDAIFVNIAGTAFGVGVTDTSIETLATLAHRCVNAINALFVGVCAAPTGTPGQFTITSLTPINGFTLVVTSGTSLAISYTGDIGVGNEGTWVVDASASSPLTPALAAYLADFCAIQHGLGQTMTVAFSQEIPGNTPEGLSPTSSTAWSQRFADGSIVQTSTGFGSTGNGVVEALVSGTYKQTGHGYVTGNTGRFANNSTGSGAWKLIVTDADHYQLGAAVANSGGYTPAVNDVVFIDLLTTQATFNPATMTAFMIKVYIQTANIMVAAGLVPWLQLGEVGWWFFSRYMSEPIGFASFTAPISIGTPDPHNLATGQNAIVAGVQGNTAANGTWPIVVTDSTHFTLTGSSGNGNYVSATGTVSGGGMAYYDAYTAAQAMASFSRPLADFWTQDDDPSVHASDVVLLSALLLAHVNAIIAAVLAVQSGAKFEVLLPLDVDHPTCYYTAQLPFPQGGRLNRAVNLPGAWMAKAGSGLSRIIYEGLSWGSEYHNLDLAIETMRYPFTTGTWSKSDVAYLFPWFNGTCPWPSEYLAAINSGIPLVKAFAIDHIVLMSLDLPLPANPIKAAIF